MTNEKLPIRSAEEAIYYLGRKYNPNFSLADPLRRKVYRRVYHCLTRIPENCQALDVDPKKGLMINGSIGVGKTDMMRIFQKMFSDTPSSFLRVEATKILDWLEEKDGRQIVKQMYGGSLRRNLYIDDLGVGDEYYKKFGNNINILGEILLERYDLWKYEGFQTHASSNLPLTDESNPGCRNLLHMYGDRVMDRMGEMMNLIVWEADSLRTNG